MKTLCGSCIFAKKENEVQNGCELSRLELFQDKELVNGSYVINNYCNTCRSEYWPHANLPLHEQKEKVYLESKIQYTLIVNIFLEDSRKTIEHFIQKVTQLEYPPEKVYYLFDMNKENSQLTLEISKTAGKNSHFSLMTCKDTFDKLHETIRRVTTAYVCIVNIDSEIDCDIITKTNDRLFYNLEMELYSSNDSLFFCPTVVYKNFSKSENPFQDIVNYAETISKCNNSELQQSESRD
jgi:hypothetical protein